MSIYPAWSQFEILSLILMISVSCKLLSSNVIIIEEQILKQERNEYLLRYLDSGFDQEFENKLQR